MEYLKKYSIIQTAVPNYQKITDFLLKNYCKVNKEPLPLACEYTGALYFPTQKLIVCSYATNHDLYIDIHALAKSSVDGTPAIPHVVLSSADGQGLQDHFDVLKRRPSYLDDNDFTRVCLANCPIIEDDSVS